MRKTCHAVLKQFFRLALIQARESKCLTQLKMASILAMDERSYSDLESGKSGCSAITFALFLIYICDDVVSFLKKLQYAFETALENVA